MAGSNYNLEITGDNSTFKRVVSDSMKQLDDLSKKTGGAFASISGQMGNMSGLLSTIKGLPGPLMAVGAAASAASLAFAAFDKTRDTVKNLNELSTASGITVENLQKMASAFKGAGIDMEGFADINQDVLDKLGDGVRDGSGVIEDLRAYGVELSQLDPLLDQADGGLKAIINTFYQLKDAGKTQAEIVNAMEAMGSNAAKLIPQLSALGSEEEALSKLANANANISNEQAEAYAKYEQAVATLSTEIDDFMVDAMTPLVDLLNEGFDAFEDVKNIINAIETGDSQNQLKALREEYGLLVDIIQTFLSLDGMVQKVSNAFDRSQDAVAKFGYEGRQWVENKTGIKNYSPVGSPQWLQEQKDNRNAPQLDANLSFAIDQANANAGASNIKSRSEIKGEGRFKNKDDEADKAKKAKSMSDAAKKASQEMAKQLAERKAMLAEINTINMSLYTQQASTFAAESQQAEANVAKLQELLGKGVITQQEFEAKRKAIIDQSSFNLEQTLLGTTDGDLSTILAGINQVYADQNANLKSQLDARLITQEQYNQKLELNEQMHTARMYEFQVAKDTSLQALRELGFTTDEENFQMEMEKMDEQFEKLQADNQARYDAQIISYEEFLASKARLEDVYAAKSTQLENDRMKSNLAIGESLATSMQGIFSGAFGEQSKAAKAAFVVSKSLAIAQSTMDAHSAATKALATYPQPMGGIMAGAAYAQVLAQVASIKSTNLTGMAHDGIDTVPEEGTWLLQKGERVVDNRTNQDLKDFLRDGSGSGAGPIEINAPLNISGNVDSSDRMVMDAINRYPEEVARMVEKAQSKRM